MHDSEHQVPVQVNGYDLVGALDMLAQLESEQTGQRKQFLQVGLSFTQSSQLRLFWSS